MKTYSFSVASIQSLSDLYSLFNFESSVLSLEDAVEKLLSIEEETIVKVDYQGVEPKRNTFLDLLENVQQKNPYLYLIRG